MATIAKSIGTSSRDYSTITLWEADLDNSAVYSSADDAVGECYNDSAFDESFTINGGGTVGLASIKLTVPEAERHDGTAGTGVRLVSTGRKSITIDHLTIIVTLEWLDLGSSGAYDQSVNVAVKRNDETGHILHGLLLHDVYTTVATFFSVELGYLCRSRIFNSILYNIRSSSQTSGASVHGLYAPNHGNAQAYNVTIHNIYADNPTKCSVVGISSYSTDIGVTNCIVTDASTCFGGSFSSNTNNLSSDATASGTSSLINKAAADQFVSTVSGSEDLHLKSGADAIDAGVDLVTTPTGVNIDINGRDRDSEGDTWDIGAHEYVAAGGDIAITASAASVTIASTVATIGLAIAITASAPGVVIAASPTSVGVASSISTTAPDTTITSSTAAVAQGLDVHITTSASDVTYASSAAAVVTTTDIAITTTSPDVAIAASASTIEQQVDTNISTAAPDIGYASSSAVIASGTDISIIAAASDCVYAASASVVALSIGINATASDVTYAASSATVSMGVDVHITTTAPDVAIASSPAVVQQASEIAASVATITYSTNAASVSRNSDIVATVSDITVASSPATVDLDTDIAITTVAPEIAYGHSPATVVGEYGIGESGIVVQPIIDLIVTEIITEIRS